MRVAFLNRGREAGPGGDAIALDATMDALRKRGHYCEETGWDRVRMKTGFFDLAHIFHCNFSWSWGNYQAVRDVGLRYVLTPIYYPGPLLCGISRSQMHEIVNNASMVLPFSNCERALYDWSGVFHSSATATDIYRRFRSIPNGTDSMFDGQDGRDHMVALDVLAVSARGDTDKNIDLVRRVCARLERSLTVATGLSRADLADAYRHHRLFVNASGSERMSLTIGEALCAGCRVLATNQNWGNEHYPGLVTFPPKDEGRLESLIKSALSSEHWDYGPNAAARSITWDWVAGQLEEVYAEVMRG